MPNCKRTLAENVEAFSGPRLTSLKALLQNASLRTIITELMNDGYETKKYAADKILLGLFALSLLLAKLITNSRSIRPLEAGDELIANIKSQGLQTLLDSQGSEWYLLVRNAETAVIGFSIETWREHSGQQWDYESTSTSYLGRPYFLQTSSVFRCSDDLRNFRLEDRTQLRSAITLQNVRVEDSNVTVEGPDGRVRLNYEAEPNSVPEYLIERIAIAISKQADKKVALKVIRHDGTEGTALIVTQETAANGRMLPAGRMVEISFPEQGRSSQIWLDNADRILRIIIHQQDILILEPANREDILRLFGRQLQDMFEQDEFEPTDAI